MLTYFTERIKIVQHNAINTFHVQTAYLFENIAGALSTLFYTVSMLAFVKILYSNVTLFAGYTENEILLLLLFAQTNFHISYVWSISNVNTLIESVRTGELDLILTKPVPDLFFVTFRDINIINLFKEGLPTILLVAGILDWSMLAIQPSTILPALVILILGQISIHCFRFLFALPVFFAGNASQLFAMSGAISDVTDIPYEGFTGALRIFFSAVIPALIASQITVSVLLGKSNVTEMLIFCTITASVFLVLKMFGWKVALRNYTSASS